MFDILLYNLKNLILIAIGIFGIGVIIGFHEFGHFLFARLFGVRVPSFSIGMGPKLFSFKVGETEFKLSAIPLGGYVEIAGLAEIGQGEQAHAHDTGEHAFSSKPYWQKACILGGGIMFNFVMAYVVFVLLFFVGMPQSPVFNQDTLRPIVQTVQTGGAAQRAQLAPQDMIVAINTTATPTIKVLREQLAANKDKEITITYVRKDAIEHKAVKLDDSGILGIGFASASQPALSFGKSVLAGLVFTGNVIYKTAQVFVGLFKERSMKDVGGPLMIISQMAANAKQGLIAFLFLLAFISINIAVLNLVPLPITDGGQIVLTGIEAIIRRQIPETIKLGIFYASWGLILTLTVYLTIKDSIMLFWPTIRGWLKI